MGPAGPGSALSRRTAVRRSSKAITPGGSELPAELADVKRRGDVVIEDDSPGEPSAGGSSPEPRRPQAGASETDTDDPSRPRDRGVGESGPSTSR